MLRRALFDPFRFAAGFSPAHSAPGGFLCRTPCRLCRRNALRARFYNVPRISYCPAHRAQMHAHPALLCAAPRTALDLRAAIAFDKNDPVPGVHAPGRSVRSVSICGRVQSGAFRIPAFFCAGHLADCAAGMRCAPGFMTRRALHTAQHIVPKRMRTRQPARACGLYFCGMEYFSSAFPFRLAGNWAGPVPRLRMQKPFCAEKNPACAGHSGAGGELWIFLFYADIPCPGGQRFSLT